MAVTWKATWQNRWWPCQPWLAATLVLTLTVLQLRRQGRMWCCACGHGNLWAGDIWSAHNSQHVLDPYSFTHILHGVVFFWLLAWMLKRVSLSWRLTLAILIEAVWEVAENAPYIIQRYRTATIGLGYEGDSVINSLADILCCTAGFLLARRLGLRLSLLVFVFVELLLALAVRDNLTLNVVMLLCPIDAIKHWQMAP